MDGYHIHCNRKLWICVLSLLIILDCYFHIYVYYNVLRSHVQTRKYYDKYATTVIPNETIGYYKYPLDNSVEVSMDYKDRYNSSYYWFISMKHLFKDMGEKAAPKYTKGTPMCQLNTTLEPILVNRMNRSLEWIEQQNPDVKLGGYHAPAHCRPINRVAVIIPYRDRRFNLSILLRYLHPLLKKQLLEYRIFVIEQYGKEKFNKGTLYNIAFLETQRFGTWHCLIFQDVDLIPEDERISYSCPEHPTHMSPTVESSGNIAPYKNKFGGVTALTPEQYESVNGYSNLYWDWGADNDDFYDRIQSENYTVVRYNSSLARYSELPHQINKIGKERMDFSGDGTAADYAKELPEPDRYRENLCPTLRQAIQGVNEIMNLLVALSKLQSGKDGLTTTIYDLIRVTEEKLFTHILADVNPTKMKLGAKNLIQHFMRLTGQSVTYRQRQKK